MKVGGGEVIAGFLRAVRVRIAFFARCRTLGRSCCEAIVADKEGRARWLVGIDDDSRIARIRAGSRCSSRSLQPLIVEGFSPDLDGDKSAAVETTPRNTRAPHYTVLLR